MAAGLAALVAEHRQAVAPFGADTREDTLRRAAERIRPTQFKVEAYAEYLAGRAGQAGPGAGRRSGTSCGPRSSSSPPRPLPDIPPFTRRFLL
ncbi:MAG: hypothetical protein QM757_21520 [Paludibaculum sp.]